MKSNYGNTSINKLIGCDKVRLRPAAVLGSGGLAGARHGFTEIYGNSLDELSSGYGDRIDICYLSDGGMSIRDYGRGVPLGWNENLKEWNWHVIYNDLYGGGKYGTSQDELANQDWDNFDESKYNYLFSVGLNGLGAAATQYTSEYFTVKSYRGGKVTTVNFAKGMPIINGKMADVFRHPELFDEYVEDIQDTDEPDGTYIMWKPDIDVFSDVDVTAKWLLSKCRDIAHVAGITLTFKDFKNNKEYTFEKGSLVSYMDEKTNNGKAILDTHGNKYIYEREELHHGTIRHEAIDNFIWVCKAKVVIGLTEQAVEPRCFHNNIYMSGGDQYDAVKSAITEFFNQRAKEVNHKFEYSDYSSRVGVYVSSFSNICNFKGQTKDEVNQQFIYDIIYKIVLDTLTNEHNKGNKGLAKIIADCVTKAEERIALKELAKQVKLATKVSKKQTKQPEKFKPCKAYNNKNYKDAELWLVEGDSAAGSVSSARNSDFQAVFPLTGKFINALKKPIAKVLENRTVRDVIALIGTGVDLDLGDDEQTFNIDNLKFGKIIFCTDADVDGFQIRMLLFAMFFKLCPKLLARPEEDAILYIAETPLFELVKPNRETLYAYTEEEKNKLLKDNPASKVKRFKGLGEVDADMLAKTTISPQGRRLVPLVVDFSGQFCLDVVEALFGKDPCKQRKKMIADSLGEGVMELLEISEEELAEFEQREFEEETEVVVINV